MGARALRGMLAFDVAPMKKALDATTKEELEQAARYFKPKRTAAVIAGGAIR